MPSDPTFESQHCVFCRIFLALLPVLDGCYPGINQYLEQSECFLFICHETLLEGNGCETWQNNSTLRRDQLLGGKDPPGGRRRLPARQREHCSTAFANSADAICSS